MLNHIIFLHDVLRNHIEADNDAITRSPAASVFNSLTLS